MRLHISALQVAVLAALLANCTPGVRSMPPSQGPIASDVKPPANVPTARYLRLSAGLYRYRLIESTHVQLQEPGDTVPGIVRTDALVSVLVVPSDTDSSFLALVSIDSIRIRRDGPVPPPSMTPLVRLDSVLRVIFTPRGNVTQVLLTDSLCTYSELVTIAQDLLVSRIPNEVTVPANISYSDTLTVRGCRAGATIETVSVRKLSSSEGIPVELALQQQSTIRGSGSIRRDSLIITGPVLTSGTVMFQEGNRLPSHVKTRSDGLITVQLGSKETVFRQVSTRELQRDSVVPN